MTVLEEHSQICPADDCVVSNANPDPEVPRQRSVAASQRISALGEMATGLAHDFRNILAVIDSAIRLAGRDPDDSVSRRAALTAAREGVRRGTALTAKLLVFAKPRPHDAHAEDLNELLENLNLFLKYGAGPDIRVRLELEPGLPLCRIDAAQFSAAILNLVVNARDAMPGGGEIRIVTRQISLGEGDDAEAVLIRVIDQGEGMTDDVRKRIFDPFFTTKGETGTGLGVPQVAAFMRASGGCLNVSSAPGAGTSIDLFFPLCESPGLMGTNLWRYLDRWENEGGRTAGIGPRFGH